MGISFKKRVALEIVENASKYKSNFMDYEYLVCSKAFKNQFHTIKADSSNYLHLTGIHTKLKPSDFFDKCISNTLNESDFDFVKPGKNEKSVKGAVREKIKVLPEMVELFKNPLLAEENFKKNKVECSFATSDNKCTLGFAVSGRPKSLLKGAKLNSSKACDVDLILKKPRNSNEGFNEIVFDKSNELEKYMPSISHLLSENLREQSQS